MSDVLWSSFANVVKAGEQATALLEALTDALAEGALESFIIDIDNVAEYSWQDPHKWVTPYYLSEWKLKPKARGPAAGYLTVAISFYRPEDSQGSSWAGADSAKLYVAYTPGKTSVWDWDTLILNGAGATPHATPGTAYLWINTVKPGAWFFCVRLIELQDRDDLLREVIAPISSLLKSDRDAATFEGCRAIIGTPETTAVAPAD